MIYKLTVATFVLLSTAGMSASGSLACESGVVAITAETPVTPTAMLTGTHLVKNVRIRSLGNNDFEVAWQYEPPQNCQPEGFDVVVTVKRRIGNGILGQMTIKAGPNDRVVYFKFGSIFGIEQVTATVTGTMSFKSVAEQS